MEDLSLYIHIPFCERKCSYCDFVSFPKQFKNLEFYINSLLIELSLYKEELQGYKIKTIFIGGGTPSAIDAKYIETVLNYIYDNLNTHDDMEVSIELNPGTLDMEKLNIYKESGINRISIGLQTFSNNILQKLGRIHTAKDFYKSYDMAREAGFDNINVDLIFDLPDQTIEDGIKDIETLVELGVKHISYYSLIIEPGTLMDKWHQENKLNLLDEDSERLLYHQTKDYLKSNGYDHYEISNFALDGFRCQHNMTYWKINPYLGLGLSSHSNFKGKRFSNTSNMNDYIEKLSDFILPIVEEETIGKETEMAEFCILGLRLIEGIDKLEFKNRLNIDIDQVYGDAIDKHKGNGLLLEDENHIRLSDKGLDLANLVEVDFLP